MLDPMCCVLSIPDLIQLFLTDGKLSSLRMFSNSLHLEKRFRFCSFLNAILVHASLLQYEMNINKNVLCRFGKQLDLAK